LNEPLLQIGAVDQLDRMSLAKLPGCARTETITSRTPLQLGHASIQITVDTCGHLIPGANRAAVDRLDDAATHPSASQAHPEPLEDDATLAEMEEVLGKSGEPGRNRPECRARRAEASG
jgi:hypothetical protein